MLTFEGPLIWTSCTLPPHSLQQTSGRRAQMRAGTRRVSEGSISTLPTHLCLESDCPALGWRRTDPHLSGPQGN